MRDWPSATLRWASMGLVAVLPHTYGGLGAFSYAEPFLTARSFAEPFVLFAFCLLERGRLLPALALALVAAAFHPLIALPALAIGVLVLVMQDRRWAALLLLVLLPAALGLAGIAPFDAFWRRFDPEWWAAVRGSNANAFIADYGVLDWAPVAFDALVLVLFLRSNAAEATSRVIRAILVVVVLFTVLWGVGADLLHDVLLTQLQLWRSYWPMHLFAVLVLPRVGLGLWQQGWVGRWCVAALALAAIAVMSNWPTGWVCVAWMLAALAALRWRAASIAPTTAQAAIVASLVTIAVISFKVATTTMNAVHDRPDHFDDAGWGLVIVGLPAVGVLLGAVILWLITGERGARAAGAVVVAALLVGGLSMFDQRSAWQRRLESSTGDRPFDQVLPVDAAVYWDDDLQVPWLLARRADFFSTDQGAGLLFNRGTAVEFARRRSSLEGLKLQKELCLTIDSLTVHAGAAAPNCVPTMEVVLEACRATPHPDYLVFDAPLPAPAPALAEWHYAAPGGGSRKAYYLYACSALH
jgi:hypothetical protein